MRQQTLTSYHFRYPSWSFHCKIHYPDYSFSSHSKAAVWHVCKSFRYHENSLSLPKTKTLSSKCSPHSLYMPAVTCFLAAVLIEDHLVLFWFTALHSFCSFAVLGRTFLSLLHTVNHDVTKGSRSLVTQ